MLDPVGFNDSDTMNRIDNETAERCVNAVKSEMRKREIDPDKFYFRKTNDGRMIVHRKKYSGWNGDFGAFKRMFEEIPWLEAEYHQRKETYNYVNPDKLIS